MNKVIQFLLALVFSATAFTSSGAPRAAEDPTAVVISTTASAPRVKHEAGVEKHSAAQVKKSKSTSSMAGGKKKGGKHTVTSGKMAKHGKRAR